ncbi:MAG: hypothetical protein Q9160_004254 [Pyrenula sp. 1 TL-2023]
MLNRIRSSLFLASRPKAEEPELHQVEVRRRPNKLSKPPTNRSSNSLLSRRPIEDVEDTEISVLEPNSVSPLIEIVNESAGERRSRQDARQSLKTALFSPRAEDSQIVPQDDNYSWNGSRANLIGSAPIPRRQSDRSSTLLLPNAPDRPAAGPRRYSAITSSEVAKHFPMLESPTDAVLDPSDGDITNATDLSTLHTTSQRRSLGAMRLPMRRRSLQTPGVATRISKESLSTQEDTRDGYFANTTLAKEGTPSVIEERTEVGTPETEDWELTYYAQRPGSRAGTPSDLDYPNLGGLRSLRVTNGRPSPTPSDATNFTSRMHSRPINVTDRTSLANTSDSIPTTRFSSGGSNSTISAGTARQTHFQKPQEVQLSSMRTAHSTTVSSDTTKPTTQVSIQMPHRGTTVTTTTVMARNAVDVSSTLRQESNEQFKYNDVGVDESSLRAHHDLSESSDDFSQPLRPASPNLSGLNITTKATEFDDQLFDDEPYNTPQTEDTAWNYGTDKIPVFPNSSRSWGDSGYNSEASARASAEDNSASEDYSPFTSNDTTPMDENSSYDGALEAQMQVQSKIKKETRPLVLPSLFRKKGVSSPSVPRISDFTDSTNSLPTSATNQSDSLTESMGPKKLKKRRTSPQPAVTVQGYRELAQAHIPPIPREIVANLAKRQQHFSELDHTYKTLHHTRSFESNTTLSCLNKAQFEFPHPADDGSSPQGSVGPRKSYGLTEVLSYRPSIRKVVPFRRTKSSHEPSRAALPGEIDKATALAIIESAQCQAFDPYDGTQARHPITRSASFTNDSQETPISDSYVKSQLTSSVPPHRRETHKFVDEEEAIAFARHRSEVKQRVKDNAKYIATPRSILQSEQFNDRGRIPGKLPVARNATRMDIPPVPPMPDEVRADKVEGGTQGEDRLMKGLSPVSKNLSDRTDTTQDLQPRTKKSAVSGDVMGGNDRVEMSRSSRSPKDAWQPFLDDWSLRREAAAMRQRPSTLTSDAAAMTAAPSQNQSLHQASTIASRATSPSVSTEQHLRPPLAHSGHSSRSSSNYSQRSGVSANNRLTPDRQCRSVDSSSTDFIPSSRSQSSIHLPIPSIPRTPTPLDPCEVPPIGRYSGGLSYGFESRAGLGGSAGTRSSSGGIGGGDACRKGQRLSQDFGVDLSDVPVILSVRQA